MEFYGRNDITLGGFLEIYCFRYNTRFVARASSAPEVKMPFLRLVFPYGGDGVVLRNAE